MLGSKYLNLEKLSSNMPNKIGSNKLKENICSTCPNTHFSAEFFKCLYPSLIHPLLNYVKLSTRVILYSTCLTLTAVAQK